MHSAYTQPIDGPFHLTSSTASILSFLQLDYDVWKAGFTTRADIYDWVLASPRAHPTAILSVSPKHVERPMYQAFLQHARRKQPYRVFSHDSDGESEAEAEADPDPDPSTTFPDPDPVIKEALQFFGKVEEYRELVRSVELRKSLKKTLNGKLIQQVTGLQGLVVGQIMAHVKERCPPEELLTKSEDELRSMIQEASLVVQFSNTTLA